MFRKRITQPIWNLLIEINYLLIVFLVPLFFSAFFPTNNAFILPKVIIFKILLLLLLFAVLGRVIIYNDWRFWLKALSKKNWIILGAVVIFIGLSRLWSSSGQTAWFGSYFHQSGIITHFSLILFFVLSLYYLALPNRELRLKRIAIGALGASVLVSIYGLMQIMGLDPIQWSEPATVSGRISSTLGQPNFLASYLLLVLPLGVYIFYTSRLIWVRGLMTFIVSLQLLAFFFTASRGAWLALVIMIILGLGYLLRKKIWLMVVPAIILIVILGLSPRFLSSFDLDSGSVAARLQYWQAGFEAFQSRPLLGYGLEGQREALYPQYQVDWAVYNNVNVVPYRAHNLILDILLSTGLVGLVLFVFLAFYLSKYWFSLFKKDRPRAWLVLFSLGAYFISLLFSFSIIVTSVYVLIFLAYLLSRANSVRTAGEMAVSEPKGLIIACLLLATLFGSQQLFKVLVADYYFLGFNQAWQSNQPFVAYTYYDYIEESGVADYYYDYFILDHVYNLSYQDLDLSTRVMGERFAEKIAPKFRGRNYIEQLAGYKIMVLEHDYEGAKLMAEGLVALSPQLPFNYFDLGRIYALGGDQERANLAFRQALDLLPALDDQHLNDDHRRVIISLRRLIELEIK